MTTIVANKPSSVDPMNLYAMAKIEGEALKNCDRVEVSDIRKIQKLNDEREDSVNAAAQKAKELAPLQNAMQIVKDILVPVTIVSVLLFFVMPVVGVADTAVMMALEGTEAAVDTTTAAGSATMATLEVGQGFAQQGIEENNGASDMIGSMSTTMSKSVTDIASTQNDVAATEARVIDTEGRASRAYKY